MNIDYQTLTLGEIEQIEDLTGFALDDIVSVKVPKGKLLRALLFVMTKRTNPAFTYEDTAALSLDKALELMGGEPDPKD